MNIDRIVLGFAGGVVCASLALAYFWTPWWYILTALMGLNLLQAAFTGFCPLAFLLKTFKVAAGPAFYPGAMNRNASAGTSPHNPT